MSGNRLLDFSWLSNWLVNMNRLVAGQGLTASNRLVARVVAVAPLFFWWSFLSSLLLGLLIIFHLVIEELTAIAVIISWLLVATELPLVLSMLLLASSLLVDDGSKIWSVVLWVVEARLRSFKIFVHWSHRRAWIMLGFLPAIIFLVIFLFEIWLWLLPSSLLSWSLIILSDRSLTARAFGSLQQNLSLCFLKIFLGDKMLGLKLIKS